MMRSRIPMLALCATALALAGCGRGQNQVAKDMKSFDVMEAPPIVAPAQPGEAPAIVVAQPQIAYIYGFTYTLPGGRIAAAQAKHVALCDALGPRCRVVKMDQAGNEGQFATGSLHLVVDARIARAFGGRLDAAIADAGGSQSGRTIAAEDLSKQIVDTAARVRAKQALADRLTDLIRNRTGKVGELVEAERAFAATQEELDAARSWLSEMRQRVAMSAIDIGYNARSPDGGGIWAPVRQSLAQSGQMLGGSVAALLTFVVLATPWAILLVLLLWLRRRRGWRWPFRKPPPAA